MEVVGLSIQIHMQILEGIVVRGKGEARTIGYPTANIEYTHTEAPAFGVWTCSIKINGQSHHGLAVIGMWVQANELPSLEVHVLDFAQDIYDQRVNVSLQTKLRELETFSSLENLVAQIKQDIALARTEFHS